MRKVAVILSGCGNKDGTEITEAVSLMIALAQHQVHVEYFSLNKDVPVKNFLTDQILKEPRNMLLESARICRSDIKDIQQLDAKDFDALAFPGGYGAALHLCNWAEKGASCVVDSNIEKNIQDFYKQSKPILAICIAPVLIAKVLGSNSVTVTIGEDKETATEVQKTGAIHENCPVDDYVSDRNHKIITTPAYMYGQANPYQIFTGIQKATRELVEMA